MRMLDQESTPPEARLLHNGPKREILVKVFLSNQSGPDSLLWEMQMRNASVSIGLKANGLKPSVGLDNAGYVNMQQ